MKLYVSVWLGLGHRSGWRTERVVHSARPTSRHRLHVSRSRSEFTRPQSSKSRHGAHQNLR